jgi:hypothetical protein
VQRAASGVVILFAAIAAGAQQADRQFRVERPIVLSGAGPQRLAIDVPLLARGQRFRHVRSMERAEARAEGGLSDFRIFDAAGREVPYLLVHPSRDAEWVTATALPIAATNKASGFEADLGDVRPVDTLLVEGLPPPFLKRVVLEGSGDRAHWTLLDGEGTVFDLPHERLQQLTIPFLAGAYRYLRVTWDDTNSGRLPPPTRIGARVAPEVGMARRELIAPVAVQRRPSEPGRSRYRVRLPAAALPVVALRLDVGTGHVFRAASVSEARLDGTHAAPVVLGRDTLARIERDGAVAAALRIRIERPREAELELIVEDGQNPPLDLRSVSMELADLPWIYFEAPGGSLIARYGNPGAAAPTYDLEAVRSRLTLANVPEAQWGDPLEASSSPSGTVPMRQSGAAIDTAAFRHRRAIQAGSGGLSALVLDAAVLARSQGPARAFADVRIADQSGRQVPYLLERRDEPIAVPLALRAIPSGVTSLRSEPGHHRSIYAVMLPERGLPLPRLVLETSDRVFQRHVQVVVARRPDRSHRDAWVDVQGSARWQHAAADVAAPALVMPLRQQQETELLVVVDEGDNQPLTLTRAELLLPAWRLRFYSPPAVESGEQALWLLYGHDRLPPPQYDLALLAPQVMGAEAREVTATGEAPPADPAHPVFMGRRAFWIGLALAVLTLLGIIAKLVSGSSAAPSQPSPPHP